MSIKYKAVKSVILKPTMCNLHWQFKCYKKEKILNIKSWLDIIDRPWLISHLRYKEVWHIFQNSQKLYINLYSTIIFYSWKYWGMYYEVPHLTLLKVHIQNYVCTVIFNFYQYQKMILSVGKGMILFILLGE